MPTFFRAFVISIPRFLLLVVLFVWSQNFEVSPLPEWTLLVFVYLVQGLITYACALWVFRKKVPSWTQIFVTALLFVALQSLFETGFVLSQVRTPSWRHATELYSWASLVPLVWHIMTVAIAGLRTRRQQSVNIDHVYQR